MNTTDHKSAVSGEQDLLAISKFIFLSWKKILLMTIIGGVLGLCVAFVLPEKFKASAIISGARSFERDIEPLSVLAERMRTPSFYSANTLTACQDKVGANAAQSVLQMLGPYVSRDSQFINVNAKMRSRDAAINCLVAVLEDVKSSQRILFDSIRSSRTTELNEFEAELRKNELLKNHEMAIYQGQLEEAEKELKQAETFLQKFRSSENYPDVNDERFSASRLLVAIVSEKESQVFQLKDKLLNLKSRINAKLGFPETERAILDLKLKVALLREQLQPPITREAVFATPIYSQENKVEPRRLVIVATGVMSGGFIAILLLVVSHFIAEFKKRRESVSVD